MDRAKAAMAPVADGNCQFRRTVENLIAFDCARKTACSIRVLIVSSAGSWLLARDEYARSNSSLFIGSRPRI